MVAIHSATTIMAARRTALLPAQTLSCRRDCATRQKCYRIALLTSINPQHFCLAVRHCCCLADRQCCCRQLRRAPLLLPRRPPMLLPPTTPCAIVVASLATSQRIHGWIFLFEMIEICIALSILLNIPTSENRVCMMSSLSAAQR